MKCYRIKSLIILLVTVAKTTCFENHHDFMIHQNASSNESENQHLELENPHLELENPHLELEDPHLLLEKHNAEFDNQKEQEKHEKDFDEHNNMESHQQKIMTTQDDLGKSIEKSEFENNSHEIVSMSTENDTEKEADLEYFKPVIVKKFINIKVNSRSFPYTVALLRQTRYVCTGALISKQWVVTTADPFYNNHQYYRNFRIRLGSEDYKKGGVLIPVKNVEVHPEFNGEDPGLNVALVQLAYDAELSPSILPIKIDDDRKYKAFPQGFIVTLWAPQKIINEAALKNKTNEDIWVKARKLQVKRLTLETNSVCKKTLSANDIRLTSNLICLKNKKQRGCTRNSGAPVVQDSFLWGIITPWSPTNCQNDTSSLILAINISETSILEWILQMMRATVKDGDMNREIEPAK